MNWMGDIFLSSMELRSYFFSASNNEEQESPETATWQEAVMVRMRKCSHLRMLREEDKMELVAPRPGQNSPEACDQG